MFGGNPNSSGPKVMSGHHLSQTSGAHNNQGMGGMVAGKMANQAPAAGLNLNSTGGTRQPMPGAEPFNLGPYSEMTRIENSMGRAHEQHGSRMARLRPQEFAHLLDVEQMLQNQMLQARAAARRESRVNAYMHLLSERDERLAQQGAPRSGTHMFYGF